MTHVLPFDIFTPIFTCPSPYAVYDKDKEIMLLEIHGNSEICAQVRSYLLYLAFDQIDSSHRQGLYINPGHRSDFLRRELFSFMHADMF